MSGGQRTTRETPPIPSASEPRADKERPSFSSLERFQ
jgi:hypothetical protein